MEKRQDEWIFLCHPYQISIWAIPAIIAITFHEASHGYVAHLLGDDTAWCQGRVVEPTGAHRSVRNGRPAAYAVDVAFAVFVGYAKPVPVNFRALRYPCLGTILVAAAGPGINSLLATIAALAFHIVGYIPAPAAQWLAANRKNALLLNVVLAIFNLLPIPPLDGGRILVGILPGALARIVSRAEPDGMLILIGLIFVLPPLGAQLGINLDPISRILMALTNAILGIILRLTGNLRQQY